MKTVTSSNNSLIKHLSKLSKDRSYRRETQSLLIEGKKLIEEWLSQREAIQLYVEEGKDPILEKNTIFLKPHLCDKISSLKTQDGYFAEVEVPRYENLNTLSTLLVIDQLQNPGNLGTLIRSALAFDFEGIYIVNHSVDPFSPKVIRSSMGAVLHIPIFEGGSKELEAFLKQNHFHVYVADANGVPVEKTSFKKPTALILGNEAHGSTFKNADEFTKISIPIQNVDSLNVAIAGSLIMYQVSQSL